METKNVRLQQYTQCKLLRVPNITFTLKLDLHRVTAEALAVVNRCTFCQVFLQVYVVTQDQSSLKALMDNKTEKESPRESDSCLHELKNILQKFQVSRYKITHVIFYKVRA